MNAQSITVSVEILKPIKEVWKAWNTPADIQKGISLLMIGIVHGL